MAQTQDAQVQGDGMLQQEPLWLTSGSVSKSRTCLATCILAALSVAAIAQTPSTKSPSNPTVVITDKDNGGKVTVAKGGVAIVRLEATSGTGYSWALAKNGAPELKALGKPSIE